MLKTLTPSNLAAIAACVLGLAVAAPASAAPVACGVGLTCDWITDTDTRGDFIVAHAGAVNASRDPLKGQNHTFISPSGYWEVMFDLIDESDAADTPKFPFDEVEVKGFMQHLKRPLGKAHDTDPAQGDKFSFDLSITAFAGPVDQANGTEPHGHTDTYFALLQGDSKPAISADFSDYNFGVKGRHPEFFNDAGEVPEPPAALLTALAGLGALIASRRRAAHRPDAAMP